jgi:hypothetical protein
LSDAFSSPPQTFALTPEKQGEALGFAALGAVPGFYTTSEGDNPPIYFYAAVPEPATLGALALVGCSLKRPRRRRSI